MAWKEKPNRVYKSGNNRLNIILAIIFLLGGLIVYRLFYLQVMQNDLYTAMASNQHKVFNVLEPKRGEILIQDNPAEDNSQTYPLGTNKDFALVYSVPKKVLAAQKEADGLNKVAEQLYEIFDQEKVNAEVTRLFTANNNLNTATGAAQNIISTDEMSEFKEIKKQLEIEARKKPIIDEYLAKLNKPGDPYEPIRAKVDEAQLKKLMDLKIEGIDYTLVNQRYYPEKDLGGQLIGFVGYQSGEPSGQYGLEGFFNKELTGKPGSIRAERSANGEYVIVSDREYKKAEDGSNLILTINRSIQYYACERLRAAVERHGADSGSVIIVNPKTGGLLAMCSWPDYDPNNYSDVEDIDIYNNPAIFGQYEPGSIFKVITMAAGLDQGKVTPETTYTDKGAVKIEGWNSLIKNSDFDQVGGHGLVDMKTVLELSLNTGAILVMQKTGDKVFSDYVKNFGFGEKTGIELETESLGDISSLRAKKIRPIEVATASFGQGLTVTPLQMVMSYAAIANNGILMKPFLVKEIVRPGGEREITQSRQIRQVISARAATLLSAMMVNVVEKGHGKLAGVKGYYIGGKTGTAQVPKKGGGYEKTAHIGSFAGFGPVDDPVFTMLVKVDNPRDVLWAESSAAPLFGEIAKFILDYYQVPKER